jgi:hypothetical protein
MSSANPPYPYYNGIPFNPSFFTSDTGTGLTETAANALYLRKTTPDAATDLETFNGGISVVGTTNINVSGSSTTTIGSSNSTSLNSTTINLGTATSNIALGALTGVGATTVNKPFTPAYTYPIASGKIGAIVSGTLIPPNAQVYTNLVPKVLTTITLTPGIWLMSGSSIVNIPANSLVTQLETWIENNTTTDVFSFSCILNQQNSTATAKFIAFPMSVSIYVATTATFSQKVNITFTGTAPTVNDYQFKTQAVRIA